MTCVCLLDQTQAADAVRSRIDWKYARSLELADSGFDSTVLRECRSRLVAGAAEQRVLDAFLDACRERKWLKARGRQRTDSTRVLARVRAVNLMCQHFSWTQSPIGFSSLLIGQRGEIAIRRMTALAVIARFASPHFSQRSRKRESPVA